MKIKHLPLFLTAGAALLFSSYTVLYPNGAPPAKTGSPGDGSNCTECHGGTATTTPGLITSTIPASGYVPGTTYQITATNTLTGNGKYGFEVSPQNVAGSLLGTLIAGTGSQLVGNGKYVTHTNATTTTNSWTFSWVAPSAGTGAVTFYGAFARNKPGPVTKSTLTVQEALATPSAAGPISGPASVCQMQSETYTVGSIANATNYVWNVPVGSTISSGQGTTSITVNFGSNAVSGNVSVYGSNSSGNGAASNLAVAVNSVPLLPGVPNGPVEIDLRTVTTSQYSTIGEANQFIWQIQPTTAGNVEGTGQTATVTWNQTFSGNATINVKAQNGCGESEWSENLLVEVFNTTSAPSPNMSGIKVYAGLQTASLTIEFTETAPLARVMVLDLSGKIIADEKVPASGSQLISVICPTGIYMTIIQTGTKTYRQKVFIP